MIGAAFCCYISGTIIARNTLRDLQVSYLSKKNQDSVQRMNANLHTNCIVYSSCVRIFQLVFQFIKQICITVKTQLHLVVTSPLLNKHILLSISQRQHAVRPSLFIVPVESSQVQIIQTTMETTCCVFGGSRCRVDQRFGCPSLALT